MTMANSKEEYTPYIRRTDKKRGRYLVASRKLQKNELLWVERPICSLQSLGNAHRGALVCRSCRSFCGGPELCLKLAAGSLQRQDVFEFLESHEDGEETSNPRKFFPCRQNCGEVYCSADCEQELWPSHQYLCTGLIQEEDHPLLEFKRHAVENNEIFLLVADVIAFLIAHPESKEQFTDFTMVPWWTVATAPLINGSETETNTDAETLYRTLQMLCQDSANYLNQAFELQGVNHNLEITGEFIAKIIGSFEQNSIGIRNRHPLSREILEDSSLREKHLNDVVVCLERAGFIGDFDCEDDDCCEEDSVEKEETDQQNEAVIPGLLEQDNDDDGDVIEEKREYTFDEISNFIAHDLDIDESGGSDEGDDMDAIFTPLDGTAMYSIGCKMNHSCSPNVVVLYRTRHWNQPLVGHFMAIQDIMKGEELCICYIDCNDPVEKRQRDLANYGFQCTCQRCETEMNGEVSKEHSDDGINEDDLFGADDDADQDDLFGSDDENENDEISAVENSEDGAPENITNLVDALNEMIDQSVVARVPQKAYVEAFQFIFQRGEQLLEYLDENTRFDFCTCLSATKCRSFTSCGDSGKNLQQKLYSQLRKNGSWANEAYREAFWCCCVAGAVGAAHVSLFLESLRMLDMAMVLGLCRNDVDHLFQYVEFHANAAARFPLVHEASSSVVNDYSDATLLEETCFNCKISQTVEEASSKDIDSGLFHEIFVSQAKPVVFRDFAIDWDAKTCWRNLNSLVHMHGHRLVPIELGSMLVQDGMKEQLIPFSQFVHNFLMPSCQKPFWTLSDATGDLDNIAYLAQHPLLDQVPELEAFVEKSPSLCGESGVAHRNVWLGTGGTRTPLHYDSYDNLLVQVVGAKYVRLYKSSETPKLYLSKGANSGYAKQGNMSLLDCEMEDFEKHPLAKDAEYVEIILLPGDCLFIPSRMWHYVRALSTSISINYWW